MGIITDPAKTYTIDQFIQMKQKDNITYYNFSILEKSSVESGVYYSIDNIVYNYLEDIEDELDIVKLSETEKLKYMYKPKLVCYDVYGTSEIYFILMAINGIYNIKDFNLPENCFRALKPTEMFAFASKVYNAEEEMLLLNRKNLGLS